MHDEQSMIETSQLYQFQRMVSSDNISFTLVLLLGASSHQATEHCINSSENNSVDFPSESVCCKNDEWLVKVERGYRCVSNPCSGSSRVFYNGNCRDLFEDGACGDDLGKRLYLGEDGEAYCDCMDGWLSIDGKCYQEFTSVPEFCSGKNEILRLKKQNTEWISPEENLKILAVKLNYTFTCEENICQPGFLPHRDTFADKKCHKAPSENLDCEVVLVRDADIDNPSLKCCYPHNRSKCALESILVNFSSIVTTRAKCKKACTWSDIKKRCVKRRPRQKVKCYEMLIMNQSSLSEEEDVKNQK